MFPPTHMNPTFPRMKDLVFHHRTLFILKDFDPTSTHEIIFLRPCMAFILKGFHFVSMDET
jgi:hypothetical protein